MITQNRHDAKLSIIIDEDVGGEPGVEGVRRGIHTAHL